MMLLVALVVSLDSADDSRTSLVDLTTQSEVHYMYSMCILTNAVCTVRFECIGRIQERAFLEWVNCVAEEEFGGGDGVGREGGGPSVVFERL